MIVFTLHVLARMKQREISRDEVIMAIKSPDSVTNDKLGHSIAQLQMNDHILRVFFVERDGNTIVITAYSSSKTKYMTG
ncbi:MAG: DUF4258 domain-containing protein [Candidatus Thorarchaeota archaeon]|nr:DUF4258 domain-containing protein [Candidatus Thorarchaeota archaeon]